MENTPRLYDTLVYVLSQHAQWVDQRHLKTRAWGSGSVRTKSGGKAVVRLPTERS